MRKTPLVERLREKLTKLGLPERKAAELAKGLMPVVKAEIKKASASEPHQVGTVKPTKKNDPVGRFSIVIPSSGAPGVNLLQTMDGMTSHATYRVAAVRGEEGIVSVRRFDDHWYNVKFYPTIEHFGMTPEELAEGTHESVLTREHYQRLRMNREALEWVLGHMEEDAKPFSRMTSLSDRFKATTLKALLGSF